MSNKRPTREALGVQIGDTIVIKGEVTFARLDKPVDGDDLRKENERRQKHNMFLANRPFRSVTIKDPVIVQGEGTPLANFHGQEVYTNNNGETVISMESSSMYPPAYGHYRDGKVVVIKDPEKNPAPGQTIYLYVEAYKSKGYPNYSSTFNAIVFEEGNIEFYGGATSALEGFGKVMNVPVETMTTEVEVVDEPAQMPEQTSQSGFGAQAPVQPQQGGFGEQAPVQPQQGGFGAQAPVQPQQGGFGAPAQDTTAQSNPFGQQDSDVANTGNPVSGPFS